MAAFTARRFDCSARSSTVVHLPDGLVPFAPGLQWFQRYIPSVREAVRSHPPSHIPILRHFVRPAPHFGQAMTPEKPFCEATCTVCFTSSTVDVVSVTDIAVSSEPAESCATVATIWFAPEANVHRIHDPPYLSLNFTYHRVEHPGHNAHFVPPAISEVS